MPQYIYYEESAYEEEFEAENPKQARNWAREKLEEGSWGQDSDDFAGCRVTATVQEIDEDGEPTENNWDVYVDIEPIQPACTEDQHDWKPDPNDGCEANPGVWSLGGTSYSSVDYCLHCGLKRSRVYHGTQRNPGQADTTEYEKADEELIDQLRTYYGVDE